MPIKGTLNQIRETFTRAQSRLLWVGSVLMLGLVLLLIPPGAAYLASSAEIQGFVISSANGDPIPSATVQISDLNLTTTTDAEGQFSWQGVQISGDWISTTISIDAPSYGTWTLENVLVIAGDTLIVHAELGSEPNTITLPPPPDQRPVSPSVQGGGPQVDRVMGNQWDVPLPSTIRVRVTGNPYCNTSLPYTVETIDFKEYVKHVLPNEWVPSWPRESLRAGAMAAKMYAWSIIAASGKWSDADVYDSTCDQVYNPAVEYASTNNAVDFTWNWRLMRDDDLVRTYYRAYYSQCLDVGLGGNCMGQYDSRDMALNGSSWDEIHLYFYSGTILSEVWIPPGGYSLRFNGVYNDEENRVQISIDDPQTTDPGPPADVGQEDFTIEWWMKATSGENTSAAITCGENQNWLFGNMILDRDRYLETAKYGISLADEILAFGVTGETTGDLTLCGSTDVADGSWHHIAVQRRITDGWTWLYVDGVLEAEADGPDGDISYPDDYDPPAICGPSGDQPCVDSDPFLTIGAEKHRAAVEYPSFNGWLDEIRISNILRYSVDFTVPVDSFTADSNTVAIYHFDEGIGNFIGDSSEFSGGPSDGTRIFGGVVNGPEWTDDTVWYMPPPSPTPDHTPTAITQSTNTPEQTLTPFITPDISPTPLHTPTDEPMVTPTPTVLITPTNTGTQTGIPTTFPTETLTSTPTVSGPLPTSTTAPQSGDVNADGSINIIDLQLCINAYLGTETDPRTVSRADINNDGTINILDVQMIVNTILAG